MTLMSASTGSGSALSGLAWFNAVWTVGVEVVLVLGENLAQVCGVDDEDPVEELSAYAADTAFHDRIHARRLGRGEHDPYALGAEHLIEQPGELAVPITNHELERPRPLPQIHQQVPGLLSHPASGWVSGDAQDMHPAGGVLDDREAVQPDEHDRLDMKEITGENPVGLGP
jgi:hypothetical protein